MAKLKERRLPDPRLPEKEELPSRVHRWAVIFRARRVLLHRLGVAFSVLIISVSTFIFGRTLIGKIGRAHV